ncbi:MAG: ATP synthase F0 subunit B [Myxococcota bacterium]|jgi:F-type H+-transporting ATPase subunit b
MTSRRTLALSALGIVLVAAPALADGGLSIFPDLIEDALYGTHGGEILANPLRSTWLQLVVLFIVIVFPLNALVFKPLLRTLALRGEKIEGARSRAGTVAKQADEVLGRYEAAVGVARRSAENVRREALESARSEQARIGAAARSGAEQEVAQARAGVAGALQSARAALRGETERLAREVASKVLGRPLA